jgi:peptidoglycan/xylan/chitin deacetylase (PgdA/CDA1 family)
LLLPALNERGMKATFYLNPHGSDEDDFTRLDSWQEELLKPWVSRHRKWDTKSATIP